MRHTNFLRCILKPFIGKLKIYIVAINLKCWKILRKFFLVFYFKKFRFFCSIFRLKFFIRNLLWIQSEKYSTSVDVLHNNWYTSDSWIHLRLCIQDNIRAKFVWVSKIEYKMWNNFTENSVQLMLPKWSERKV